MGRNNLFQIICYSKNKCYQIICYSKTNVITSHAIMDVHINIHPTTYHMKRCIIMLF